MPAQLECVVELPICIHPIYLDGIHGSNNKRQALAIPAGLDQVCDINGIMVELHLETRFFPTRWFRAYPELVYLLPFRECIGANRLKDGQEAVASDERQPGLEFDVAEVERNIGSANRRRESEDVPEAASRVRRLRNILVPYLEFQILPDRANVLACKRAVPCGLCLIG